MCDVPCTRHVHTPIAAEALQELCPVGEQAELELGELQQVRLRAAAGGGTCVSAHTHAVCMMTSFPPSHAPSARTLAR